MGAGQQILLAESGNAATPPPDPSTISGLALWLHPRSIGLANGNPISTWADSSGNARDATGVGATRPTFRSSGGSNNQPYAEFDGSDDQMALPDFATAFTAGHFFTVVKLDVDPPAAGAQTSCPLRVSTSGGDASHFPWTDGIIYDNWGSTTRKTVGDPATTLAQWNTYTVLTKANRWTAWLNGTQLFTTATNTVGFISVLRIAVNANSDHLDGNIHEIIWYNRELAPSEIATVQTYITYWYGLSFATIDRSIIAAQSFNWTLASSIADVGTDFNPLEIQVFS